MEAASTAHARGGGGGGGGECGGGEWGKTAWTEKYEPTRLAEIIGHRSAVQLCENMCACNMAHSMVVYGPSGIGKTTLVRQFVRQCLGPRVNRQLLWFHMSDDRNIQVVREKLGHFVSRVVEPNTTKLVVFDDADNLGEGIQHMLRRTMEQQDKRHTAVILVSNQLSSIIESVQSRCFVIRLQALPTEAVERHLASILRREGVAYDDQAVHEAALMTEGDMRKALNYMRMCTCAGAPRVTCEVVRRIFMYPQYDRVDRVIRWILGPAIAPADADATTQTQPPLHCAVHALETLYAEGFSAKDIVNFLRVVMRLYAERIPKALAIDLHKALGVCFTRLNTVDSMLQLLGGLAQLRRAARAHGAKGAATLAS